MSGKQSGSDSASASGSGPSEEIKMEANENGPADGEILPVIDRLKEEVRAKRLSDIKKRIEENRQKLLKVTMEKARSNAAASNSGEDVNLLMMRQRDAINLQNGVEASITNWGSGTSEDDGIPSPVILMGTDMPVKSSIRPIILPRVKRLPPYTTWVFLDKNQRMAEDQSVVGRRRIYYDRDDGEALICSDSEEERTEEDQKQEFTEPEDLIIRRTVQELGLFDNVLDSLGKSLSRKPSEVKARFEFLRGKEEVVGSRNKDTDGNLQEDNPYLDKDLDGAMDSIDNLFCRRCYVFDCKLHGCSQDLVFPCKKQPPRSRPDDGLPCGPSCYRMVKCVESDVKTSQGCDSLDENARHADSASESMLSQKISAGSRRQRLTMGCQNESVSSNPIDLPGKQLDVVKSDCESVTAEPSSQPNITANDRHAKGHNHPIKKEGFPGQSSGKQEINNEKPWRLFEKSLFEKGLEIFGRDSCAIARNLLSGMRTCLEIHQYMIGNSLSSSSGDDEINGEGASANEAKRSRVVRRKGKARRLKFTWKSTTYNTMRKRISEMKDQPCRQYNPCNCKTACTKECSCRSNGLCCEKYCGCPTNCKFRFGGCQCVKSQCRSRLCPCFAADRECDPDVCKSCWVSCGDGTLGAPKHGGDNIHECQNMKLLLRQQQRVLLGISDVSGWGAFLKNSVPKNEYLGEYTGELISHREADKRGKIYDRENSSFLFNLNDQFVLDANRKGDKLKFANHSPNPNCYAKVMMVAGDHRVGIYAKDHIDAGEELFYDYRYEPDSAPAWARKLSGSRSKKGDAGPSTGRRAKKLA